MPLMVTRSDQSEWWPAPKKSSTYKNHSKKIFKILQITSYRKMADHNI